MGVHKASLVTNRVLPAFSVASSTGNTDSGSNPAENSTDIKRSRMLGAAWNPNAWKPFVVLGTAGAVRDQDACCLYAVAAQVLRGGSHQKCCDDHLRSTNAVRSGTHTAIPDQGTTILRKCLLLYPEQM